LKLPSVLRTSSIAQLVFGWTAGGALLLFLVGSSVVIIRADDRARSAEIARYSDTVGTLAITAERSMARDPVLVTKLLESVVASRGVERALVLDPQLTIVNATRQELFGKKPDLSAEILRRLRDAAQENRIVVTSDVGTGHTWFLGSFPWPPGPGEAHGNARGLALVEIDIEGMVADQRREFAESVFLMLLVVLGVGLVFLAMLYKLMKSSIADLTAVAEDIGAGNYSRRAQPFQLRDLDATGQAFNRMAEAITRALDKIEESRERYRSLVDVAGDAIVTINDRGEIVGYNKAAETLFGYSTEEVLGRSISMLLPKDLRGRHAAWIDDYQRGTGMLPPARTLQGLTRDGRTIDDEISVSTLRSREGPLHTSIIRDVTERIAKDRELMGYREQLEQLVAARTTELQQQRDLAEAATRSKSEFLAT